MSAALQAHAAAFRSQVPSLGGGNFLPPSGGTPFVAVVLSSQDKPAPGKLSQVAASSTGHHFRHVAADVEPALKTGDYVVSESGSLRVRLGRLLSSPSNPVASHACELV